MSRCKSSPRTSTRPSCNRRNDKLDCACLKLAKATCVPSGDPPDPGSHKSGQIGCDKLCAADCRAPLRAASNRSSGPTTAHESIPFQPSKRCDTQPAATAQWSADSGQLQPLTQHDRRVGSHAAEPDAAQPRATAVVAAGARRQASRCGHGGACCTTGLVISQRLLLQTRGTWDRASADKLRRQ